MLIVNYFFNLPKQSVVTPSSNCLPIVFACLLTLFKPACASVNLKQMCSWCHAPHSKCVTSWSCPGRVVCRSVYPAKTHLHITALPLFIRSLKHTLAQPFLPAIGNEWSCICTPRKINVYREGRQIQETKPSRTKPTFHRTEHNAIYFRQALTPYWNIM